jgi:hypothetical protein
MKISQNVSARAVYFATQITEIVLGKAGISADSVSRLPRFPELCSSYRRCTRATTWSFVT